MSKKYINPFEYEPPEKPAASTNFTPYKPAAVSVHSDEIKNEESHASSSEATESTLNDHSFGLAEESLATPLKSTMLVEFFKSAFSSIPHQQAVLNRRIPLWIMVVLVAAFPVLNLAQVLLNQSSIFGLTIIVSAVLQLIGGVVMFFLFTGWLAKWLDGSKNPNFGAHMVRTVYFHNYLIMLGLMLVLMLLFFLVPSLAVVEGVLMIVFYVLSIMFFSKTLSTATVAVNKPIGVIGRSFVISLVLGILYTVVLLPIVAMVGVAEFGKSALSEGDFSSALENLQSESVLDDADEISEDRAERNRQNQVMSDIQARIDGSQNVMEKRFYEEYQKILQANIDGSLTNTEASTRIEVLKKQYADAQQRARSQ